MNQEIKEKWGGVTPEVGDWVQDKSGYKHRLSDQSSLPSSWLVFEPIKVTTSNIHALLAAQEKWVTDVLHILSVNGYYPVNLTYIHQFQKLYRLYNGGQELEFNWQ